MPPTLPTMLRRSLRLRCVHCGHGTVFDGWKTRESCPRCGLAFARVDGFWLGAMIVNTAVTLFVFLAVFVGGMLLTWPTVPWTGLAVATIAVNVVVPVAFYRWSRTIWMALEARVHPIEPEESAAARNRRDAEVGRSPALEALPPFDGSQG